MTITTKEPTYRAPSLAKIAIPKAWGALVPRQRLFDALSTGVAGPLTVVSGPAGSGKTALLTSWIAGDLPGGKVAWVTLDPGDDQPATFWSYVLESLHVHGVELPVTLRRPRYADGVHRSFLEDLAGTLADSDETVTLVLDRFENVVDRRVLKQLEFVLRHAQPELRLVLATRRVPGGPFSAYVLSGAVTQIRAAQLAFRPEEARALLTQRDVQLSQAALEDKQRHTEGWAAGLCLDADDLTDYLLEEVLESQTEPVRQFLLLTSVVDHLTVPLAVWLSRRPDAGEILLELAKDHALVEAVTQAEPCYRFHPVFAEVLRGELRRRHHATFAAQHGRAARWFHAQGDENRAGFHSRRAGGAGP